MGVRINRQNGLCTRCTDLQHLREAITYNEALQREAEELAPSGDLEELARDRAMMRQRNSRLRRKYGLGGGS